MTCKSLPGMSVLASSQASQWKALDAFVLDGRSESPFCHRGDVHRVVFHLRGSARVEWKSPGRFVRFFSSPGAFTVIPARVESEFVFDRPIQILALNIKPGTLESLACDAWDLNDATVELTPAPNKRDQEFWNLGQKLASLLQAPSAGARIYAEALQTQICLQLLWRFSSLGTPAESEPESAEGQRFKRVLDYIQASLGDELSLNELASVAGYSPNYFLGAFKRATGRSPHIYLTEQRILRACELLKNPHRPIVAVALEVGFSSQSHFTSVFRRLRKTTPAAYRRDVLGISAEDPTL